MVFSDDVIKTVARCGGAELAIEETCEIAGISVADFNASEELRAVYRREQLRTKLAIRQAVIKLAKEGVPQMVKIYLDVYADQTKLPEKLIETDLEIEL